MKWTDCAKPKSTHIVTYELCMLTGTCKNERIFFLAVSKSGFALPCIQIHMFCTLVFKNSNGFLKSFFPCFTPLQRTRKFFICVLACSVCSVDHFSTFLTAKGVTLTVFEMPRTGKYHSWWLCSGCWNSHLDLHYLSRFFNQKLFSNQMLRRKLGIKKWAISAPIFDEKLTGLQVVFINRYI